MIQKRHNASIQSNVAWKPAFSPKAGFRVLCASFHASMVGPDVRPQFAQGYPEHLVVAQSADHADGAFPLQLLVERMVGAPSLDGIGQREAVPLENLL